MEMGGISQVIRAVRVDGQHFNIHELPAGMMPHGGSRFGIQLSNVIVAICALGALIAIP